jgi:phosphoribosyl-AMP cyclohydrolase / phosphoribosyl-ATP pyrophosphohydrolase
VTNLPSGLAVRYDDRGLIPAVVQDARRGDVLMLGFMNADALARTLSSGDVWFWSRSRSQLWHKGDTSGNYLRVVEVRVDCDGDALLVRALPEGPTCHTGRSSCFSQIAPTENARPEPAPSGGEVLNALYQTILDRKRHPEEGSYTNYLLENGVDRIGRKIGEEAAEVIIAAKNAHAPEITGEVADLFYHALVLIGERGVTLDDVGDVLRQREGAPRRHKS